MDNRLLPKLSGLLIYLLAACGPALLPENGALPPAPAPIELSQTAEPESLHSALYLPDVPLEDAILYFNEVCLDSEFINSGDPSRVQKWDVPIRYTLEGDYTEADASLLHSFGDWLGCTEGFPGFSRTEDPAERNLRIFFCSQRELVDTLGPEFEFVDGGVTFWYTDDRIYDAVICVLSELEPPLRTSVLLEEVYNALGPIQDTTLRPDSLIYQEYSMPQWLTPTDELILRLLYHPEMIPGMNAAECAQVIQSLYY